MKTQITAMDKMADELINLRALNSHTPQTEYRMQTLETFFSLFQTKNETERKIILDIINTDRASNMWLRISTDKTKSMSAASQKNIDLFGTRGFNQLTEEKDIQCMVNFVYENRINNQLDREDKEKSFVAGSRAWGDYVCKGIVVSAEKQEIYLSLSITHSENHKWFDENGNDVSRETYNTWLLPSKRPEVLQQKARIHQGTEDVVNYINLKISSIKMIHHNKQEFNRENQSVNVR
jgi:hypothetical protein